jgi:hypothetical protein
MAGAAEALPPTFTALPPTFTLTILDEDGGEQGDWMCQLEPDTSSYASECGEFRVSFDGESCWVYTGGVFADQYLSAPGAAGVLPRGGWVGVEGGPAEGYFGRLAVGAEDAQFEVEGDTAWLGGGAREGGEGAAPPPRPPQAPPPGSCLEPAEAPCGNMCEMRQAACCVMMDKRPLALPGEGYESYVDGVGYAMTADRHEWYCPTCRNRVSAERAAAAAASGEAPPAGQLAAGGRGVRGHVAAETGLWGPSFVVLGGTGAAAAEITGGGKEARRAPATGGGGGGGGGDGCDGAGDGGDGGHDGTHAHACSVAITGVGASEYGLEVVGGGCHLLCVGLVAATKELEGAVGDISGDADAWMLRCGTGALCGGGRGGATALGGDEATAAAAAGGGAGMGADGAATAAITAGARITLRLDRAAGTLRFFVDDEPHGPAHEGVVGAVKLCVSMGSPDAAVRIL